MAQFEAKVTFKLPACESKYVVGEGFKFMLSPNQSETVAIHAAPDELPHGACIMQCGYMHFLITEDVLGLMQSFVKSNSIMVDRMSAIRKIEVIEVKEASIEEGQKED